MNLKELSEKLELEESEFLELFDLFVKTCYSDLNILQSAIDKGDAPRGSKCCPFHKRCCYNSWVNGDIRICKKNRDECT